MSVVFYVELVWNREFNFVPFGPSHDNINSAINAANFAEKIGDGATVKKTRIVNQYGVVVWAYGKKVEDV